MKTGDRIFLVSRSRYGGLGMATATITKITPKFYYISNTHELFNNSYLYVGKRVYKDAAGLGDYWKPVTTFREAKDWCLVALAEARISLDKMIVKNTEEIAELQAFEWEKPE